MPAHRLPLTSRRAMRLVGLLGAAAVLSGCAAAESAPGASASPSDAAGLATSASAGLGASASASPSSARPTSTPVSAPTEISVTIADGTITPRPANISVARGSRVVLRVTSDRADEVHVHDYDRSATLTPGRTATIEFSADRTGQFEVETHDSSRTLFQLLVR